MCGIKILVINIMCLFILVKNTYGTVTLEFSLWDNRTHLLCDRSLEDSSASSHTLMEDGHVEIKINYKAMINQIRCFDYKTGHEFFKIAFKKIFKVKVEGKWGTLWDCEIRTLINMNFLKPLVFDKDNYTAPHCYIQVHVRRNKAPQKILVNNQEMQLQRQEVSEKEVDFKLFYEYANTDAAAIMCENNDEISQTRLFLNMYHTSVINDFRTLSSQMALGVLANLHAGYNNSRISCNHTSDNDFTVVEVIFLLQPKYENLLKVNINGLTMRPKYTETNNKTAKYNVIPYNIYKGQNISLICELKSGSNQLKVFVKPTNYFNFTEADPNRAEANFSLTDTKKMECSTKNMITNKLSENYAIKFKLSRKYKKDPCQLNFILPKNNIVLELIEMQKLKIVYYEYDVGDTITVTCLASCPKRVVQVKMQVGNMNETNPNDVKHINRTFSLTGSNLATACYLFEISDSNNDAEILREVKFIFRPKVIIATTSTTEISSVLNRNELNGEHENDGIFFNFWFWIAAGVVTVLIVVCISIIIYSMYKPKRHQGQEFSNHEFPIQLENNYAVPVDQRHDNETYSEPFKPVEILYSTPIPKSERKKQKKTGDSNYASLNLPKNANRFKATENTEYAEIPNNMNVTYSTVLPKSERLRNIGWSQASGEPTYCEPNMVIPNAVYNNLTNNSDYNNKTGDNDLIEPNYSQVVCKRK